jgi:hypothetical protein
LFTDLPEWFLPAAQYFYLLTNRTRYSGSVPEAIRRTISLPVCPNAVKAGLLRKLDLKKLPVCPPELRAQIVQREREGKPFLTECLMRQIPCSRIATQSHRNNTEAGLTYLNAPGSTMWLNDPETGRRTFVRAGDIVEADDGTINFPVCVPWEIGGDKCSDKFGVKVGRYQWLRSVDVASRFKPAYVYVCRPRGSYRAEDILTLIHAICRQYGIPRQFRFEKGSWLSKRVTDLIARLGAHLHTVHSPRQKPYVEGGFNQAWTKLSF